MRWQLRCSLAGQDTSVQRSLPSRKHCSPLVIITRIHYKTHQHNQEAWHLLCKNISPSSLFLERVEIGRESEREREREREKETDTDWQRFVLLTFSWPTLWFHIQGLISLLPWRGVLDRVPPGSHSFPAPFGHSLTALQTLLCSTDRLTDWPWLTETHRDWPSEDEYQCIYNLITPTLFFQVPDSYDLSTPTQRLVSANHFVYTVVSSVEISN